MTPEGRPADELDLDQVEEGLRTRLAEIRDQIAELTTPPDADATEIGFGKRIGEGTTEAISRFTDVGVANDLQRIEERIDRALEKLDEGSYGVCDNCGGEIVAGRLKAAPESVLCIECARAAES